MNIIFKMLKYLKNYSNLIKCVMIIILLAILIIHNVFLISYKSSYQEEVELGLTRQIELDSIKELNERLKNQISIQEQDILDKKIKIQKLVSDNQILQEATFSAAGNILKSAENGFISAQQIWTSLRVLGFNKYVCAGILGNIMAEVGGQTLNIQWTTFSEGDCFGICQWTGERKQRLLNNFGTTLEDQIRFLSVELFEVIPKDNSFYNMQDEREAALYFAKYYERCGPGSYYARQQNATKALNFFTQ